MCLGACAHTNSSTLFQYRHTMKKWYCAKYRRSLPCQAKSTVESILKKPTTEQESLWDDALETMTRQADKSKLNAEYKDMFRMFCEKALAEPLRATICKHPVMLKRYNTSVTM